MKLRLLFLLVFMAMSLHVFGQDASAPTKVAGKTADEWGRVLKAGGEGRLEAVRRLGQFAQARPALAYLIEGLADEELEDPIAEALSELPAEQVASGLQAAFKLRFARPEDDRSEAEVRILYGLVTNLGRLGSRAKRAYSELATAYSSSGGALGNRLLTALVQIDPDAAAPTVVEARVSDDFFLDFAARQALKELGVRAAPALIDAFTRGGDEQLLAPIRDIGLAALPAIEKTVRAARDLEQRSRALRAALLFRLPRQHSLRGLIRDLAYSARLEDRLLVAEAMDGRGASENAFTLPLLEDLAHEDEGSSAVRERALAALATHGEAARRFLGVVRAALRDPERAVRSRALSCLARISGDPAEIDRAIVAALADPELEVNKVAVALLKDEAKRAERLRAELVALARRRIEQHEFSVEVIELVAESGDRGVAAVRALLDDTEPGARVLGILGVVGVERARQLVGRSVAVRLAAFLDEARAGKAPLKSKILDAFRGELTEEGTPFEAAGFELILLASALEELAAEAAPAVPQLLALLEHPGEEVRKAAAAALGALGEAGGQAAPGLAALLSKEDPVAISAARVLAGLGEPAAAAAPSLIEHAEGGSPELREAAIEALGRLGEAAEGALPTLARIASGADQPIALRRRAVAALGAIARRRDVAVPALIGALNRRELEDLALRALTAYRAREALDRAAAILKDTQRPRLTRSAAAGLLGALGEPAAPVLSELLAEGDELTRLLALRALKSLGPRGLASQSSALELWGAGSGLLRSEAATALAAMGPKALGSILDRAATLPEDRRSEAAELLASINGVAPSLGAQLDRETEKASEEGAVRERSLARRGILIAALAELGSKALPAVPILTRQLRDEDLRAEAMIALKKIWGESE